MNNGNIYATMVVRSQAEAIKLLEKENQQLKEKNELEFNDFIKFRKEQEDRQEDRHLEEKDKLIKENFHLRKQLQQKNEVIERAVSQIWYMQNHEPANSNEYDFYCRKLIWILTSKEDKNGRIHYKKYD